MPKIYKILFLVVVAITAKTNVTAQVANDSVPTSVNVPLENIFNAKTPKEYVISDIKVTGTSFDPNLIISISGLAVGDKVKIPGGDNFSRAISNLWKQNLVSDVQIYFTNLVGDKLSVEINITDRPSLTNFKFKGVSKSEADDLTPKLGLAKGKVTRVTENLKTTAATVIKKFYVDKGFRNVDVKVNETKDPKNANAVNIVFVVNKNAKVHIKDIYFAGNESVSALRLKKQMKGTKEMSRFTLFPTSVGNVFDSGKTNRISFNGYLRTNGYLIPSKTKEVLDPYFRFKLSSAKFNEKKYLEDKGHVLDYYNSLGFRDAIIEGDTTYNDHGDLDVAIKLKEGHRYYFGNITWKGNTKYSDSLLSLLLGIKKGDIYNAETLNKKLGKEPSAEGGDISSLYQDDGYLFFRIDPVETAVYNDTIDHEIRIVEGPQATIGKVTITGNDKTKDYVIRRELRTVPGDKFSRELIIRTQRELSQLGYFNPEKINPGIVPNTEEGTVDINWGLEEKSSDQLELSAGFGGGIGLTGTLGVTFNNFSIYNIFNKKSWDPLPSGDGQKLSLRGQSNGKQFRSYNFSFTEPWLGGKKRNSFTISYYDTKYANAYNPLTGYYDRSYGDSSFIKTTGFSVALGKQLKWPDDYFSLVYQLDYQRYKLKNYNIFPGLTNGISNNFSLKITLARNSAGPNPIFPTSGSNFVLSGQFTPPYSFFHSAEFYQNQAKADQYKLVEFHKERFNAEWYVPIGKGRGPDKNKQFILKAAAKYGFLGRYTNKTITSPFERFQLGDAGLSNNYGLLGYDIIAHRGYPVYDNSDPKVNPDISTASNFFTIFNKYTLEMRYPFSTSASSTIFGEAFFEAANGWYSFKDYNPFKLRRSVGVGMRFFLPMFGLLGFDYGIGLDRLNSTTGLKGAAKFTFMLGQEPE
ncbi:outer membrane protein assembly factor [Ginsengibacter hankyongi]|uniref:Outer membrane protein assembly factor n=1 Tax=Ginsengibacter hankyongi TaxID=2607284 RepID=A0A5J5ING8_9BACT|nr:POTRA domain-containing protein [Ginsengibacter hankyongi]KAA9041873.1 outer membrane protein assembly factor [Ginsengibacter hankyongi]